MKFPKKFQVKRSRWVHGVTKAEDRKGKLLEESALLLSNGHMCCVGFYARACGYKKDDLLHVSRLREVRGEENVDRFAKYGEIVDPTSRYGNVSPVIGAIYEVNDGAMGSSAREKLLTKLFVKIGVEVQFVD